MLPETDIARVRRWVRARNDGLPERAVGLIRYEVDVDPRTLTVLECRPPWREDFGPDWSRRPAARLRFTKARNEWDLYWSDRNGKFHRYDRVQPTGNIERLLEEVDADPTCIFWG